MVGKLELKVKNGKITEWEFKQNVVTDDIKEDKTIAAKVAKARAPFVKGSFVPGQTVTVGGNTTMLMRPVDEVIAYHRRWACTAPTSWMRTCPAWSKAPRTT